MDTQNNVKSITFENYKGLSEFSVRLSDVNILTGANNGGKSTVIGAFRILNEAFRVARRLNGRSHSISGINFKGWVVPTDKLPVSTENVHTDYEDVETKIIFELTNGRKVYINFSIDGECYMTIDNQFGIIMNTIAFKEQIDFKLSCIPVLGPIEKTEKILKEEYVRNRLNSPIASRHFRNYWYHFPLQFERFASLISTTWPGMVIRPPERQNGDEIYIFVEENRIPRELFWSGFGFQIWCQIITHIVRSNDSAMIIIDEPEVYLHPEIQRQLLGILRNLGPRLVVATHSTEIISEAEPSELLHIDKNRKNAIKIKDVEGMQSILDAIGSIQNITLTYLARNRKIIFVEGMEDYKIIRRFAQKLKASAVSNGSGVTPVESGGFSSWEKLKSVAWGFDKTIGGSLKMAVIYDRDYYSESELEDIFSDIPSNLGFHHLHSRKEIENYLCDKLPIYRALNKELKRRGGDIISFDDFSEMYYSAEGEIKDDAAAAYSGKMIDYSRKKGIDAVTALKESKRWFDSMWQEESERIKIIPGKTFIKLLRNMISESYGVSLNNNKIIDEFKLDEIDEDLKGLIEKIEHYLNS